MIWIRADANKEIGSGHMMRCLSIAEALQQKGKEVRFLVADESAKELLRSKGQNYRILNSSYDKMEEELEELIGMLAEYQPDLLLIDSYYVTENYLRSLREYVKVIYMDDIPRFAYPVDGIINYNIYGDSMPYGEMAPDGGQELLLGPSYAPLRKQFREVTYTVRPVAENVLITTGGSDKYNLAGRILKEVLAGAANSKLHYHVVSGAFNPHYSMLEELAGEHGNISLYRNVTDMAELMQKCDIAITAGGSTMYELCAVGVPTLCFSFVDNQELIVKTFLQKKLVAYGGDYLTEKEMFPANVAAALEALAGDRELRQWYSDRVRQLVDGCGADRIAEALCR